jgi:hypothetical protein
VKIICYNFKNIIYLNDLLIFLLQIEREKKKKKKLTNKTLGRTFEAKNGPRSLATLKLMYSNPIQSILSNILIDHWSIDYDLIGYKGK